MKYIRNNERNESLTIHAEAFFKNIFTRRFQSNLIPEPGVSTVAWRQTWCVKNLVPIDEVVKHPQEVIH
jgi:hypothetical protein